MLESDFVMRLELERRRGKVVKLEESLSLHFSFPSVRPSPLSNVDGGPGPGPGGLLADAILLLISRILFY